MLQISIHFALIMIQKIGSLRKQWFIYNFSDDFETNVNNQIELSYMKDGLSDVMVESVELSNSSHYNVFDDSITVTTWIEEKLNVTDNWFLVFPNVTYDEKKLSSSNYFLDVLFLGIQAY